MKNKIFVISLLCVAFCYSQEPQWELVTDKYSVNTIAVDPTNSQKLYIDAEYGFYKTSDGGASWDTIGTGLNNRPAKIIVDHNNPDILWAGGPTPRTGTLPEWMAIAKSTDAGESWFKSDSGIATYFHGDRLYGLEIDRSRDILYAYDNVIPVYKSVDGGKYWENISTLELPGGVDLCVDDDDGTLYFASNGVWKKGLKDEKWIRVSKGLPKDPFENYHDVLQIASARSSNILYCIVDTVGNGTISRLYKSKNNGQKWFPLEFYSRYNVKDIILLNADTNSVLIAGYNTIDSISGLYFSNDGALSFTLLKKGIPQTYESFVKNIAINQTDQVIYATYTFDQNGSYADAIYKIDLKSITGLPKRDNIPHKTLLYPAYPNPFNSATKLRFETGGNTKLSLKIYDIRGREVKTLFGGYKQPGIHEITWDGTDNAGRSISGGVYFIRLLSGSNVEIRKVVYIP